MLLFSLLLSIPTFANLGFQIQNPQNQHQSTSPLPLLPPWLSSRLHQLNFTHPTPIQSSAIIKLLGHQNSQNSQNSAPCDAIIHSPTSSGKTLAYLIPLLASLDLTKKNVVQGVVIVPTRELGLQVSKVARQLIAGFPGDKVHIMSLLAGSPLTRQHAWGRQTPPALIVGTVNEVLSFFERGVVGRGGVKFVVVDEVDECFGRSGSGSSSGSGDDMKRTVGRVFSYSFKEKDGNNNNNNNIYYDDVDNFENTERVPPPTVRQTVFASATIPQRRHFQKRCKEEKFFSNERVEYVTEQNSDSSDSDSESDSVSASESSIIPPQIKHKYHLIEEERDRLKALKKIFKLLLTADANANADSEARR